MKPRFIPEVELRLRENGWYPGRQIGDQELHKMEKLRPLFPAARMALQEFFGILVPDQGKTFMENGSLNSSQYKPGFCVDPISVLEVEENNIFDEFEVRLSRKVYPLGFIQYFYEENPLRLRGLDVMYIDESGRVFSFLYRDLLIGKTIDEAINNLLMQKGYIVWNLEQDKPL